VYDGHAFPAKPIEKTAFSDIGTPDKGNGSGWIDHDKKKLKDRSQKSALKLDDVFSKPRINADRTRIKNKQPKIRAHPRESVAKNL
jgi:hypothetical protein